MPVDWHASNSKLAVLLCMFNVQPDSLQLSNYYKCIKALRAVNVVVYTIEGSLTGDFQVYDNLGTTLRVRCYDPYWHKERLLNILAYAIPPRYKYLAWLDADVMFCNPEWIWQTEEELKRHAVVQLFGSIDWMDATGTEVKYTWSGGIRGWRKDPTVLQKREWARYLHPGFGWAMHRELWQQLGGLIERAGTMCGDLLMFNSFTGHDCYYDDVELHRNCHAVQSWMERARNTVAGSVGYVDGVIQHLWHGNIKSRQYHTLCHELIACGMDLDRDLYEDCDGPYVTPLRVRREALKDIYRVFFAQRGN